MKKMIVTTTMAMLLMSSVGLAQPSHGRNYQPADQHLKQQMPNREALVPKHRLSQQRSDGDARSQQWSDRDRNGRADDAQNYQSSPFRPDRDARTQSRLNKENLSHNQTPERRPGRDEIVHHYQPLQPQHHNNQTNREDKFPHPTNSRNNLTPPNIPAHTPINPAPAFSNSPGTDVGFTGYGLNQ